MKQVDTDSHEEECRYQQKVREQAYLRSGGRGDCADRDSGRKVDEPVEEPERA
jgi:hypothetical protein